MDIKGLTVNRVLVVPAEQIEEEYYFSYLLDRSNRSYLCIASIEGGVEIEEVAKTNPDAVKKIAIDPVTGVDEAKATEIVDESEFPEALRDQAISLVQKLWTVFVEEDATLVEVNPLARLAGDKLEALDGKISLDDERRLPPRGPRAVRGQGRCRPAGGQGQGEGPQLRQARRCRRHHRQRRRAGHVDPRRRRVRR